MPVALLYPPSVAQTREAPPGLALSRERSTSPPIARWQHSLAGEHGDKTRSQNPSYNRPNTTRSTHGQRSSASGKPVEKTTFYHLYYSGMELEDIDPAWRKEHESDFCTRCTRIKTINKKIDISVVGRFNRKEDMAIAGHMLIPGIISARLLLALGDAASLDLNIGEITELGNQGKKSEKYFTFTSRYEYVTLRGENPSIFDGKPVPEDERFIVCQECGFKAYRERSPWFLTEDERPPHPISCTDWGLLLNEEAYLKIKDMKLNKVSVQKVNVKPA